MKYSSLNYPASRRPITNFPTSPCSRSTDRHQPPLERSAHADTGETRPRVAINSLLNATDGPETQGEQQLALFVGNHVISAGEPDANQESGASKTEILKGQKAVAIADSSYTPARALRCGPSTRKKSIDEYALYFIQLRLSAPCFKMLSGGNGYKSKRQRRELETRSTPAEESYEKGHSELLEIADRLPAHLAELKELPGELLLPIYYRHCETIYKILQHICSCEYADPHACRSSATVARKLLQLMESILRDARRLEASEGPF